MSVPTIPSPSYQPQLPPTSPLQPRDGMGTAGFVLGLLAAIFALIPIIGVIAWPLSILGLVFGIVGISRARRGVANNKGLAVAGTVLAAIALVLCLAWTAALGATADQVNSELTQPATAAPTAPAELATPDIPETVAPAPPAPAGPAEEIGEGTWRVGEDIVAGTYRTTGPNDSGIGMCYWDRANNSSGEFNALITNGILEGPGVVTVNDGEVFTSNGCATWTLTS